MKTLPCLALVAVLAGCGHPNDSDTNTIDTVFGPDSGTWTGGDVTVVSNTCAAGDPNTDATTPLLALKDVGDGTFLLTNTAHDNAMIQLCTLTDMAFTCGTTTFEIAVGDNATVHVGVDLGGEFTDATHMTLTTTVDESCDGSDCADLAAHDTNNPQTWPCQGVFSLPASL